MDRVWPVGTRLLAPHRLACRDHIYEVQSDVIVIPGQPGQYQITKCLVCDEVTQPLDVTRWYLADSVAIKQCLASIEADLIRLHQAQDILNGERVWRNVD